MSEAPKVAINGQIDEEFSQALWEVAKQREAAYELAEREAIQAEAKAFLVLGEKGLRIEWEAEVET